VGSQLYFYSLSLSVVYLFSALVVTVRGFAQRGFQDSNVSKVTQTSKQLDDFLKLKCPRCAKPLLAEVIVD
jgi:hypothetical protein